MSAERYVMTSADRSPTSKKQSPRIEAGVFTNKEREGEGGGGYR